MFVRSIKKFLLLDNAPGLILILTAFLAVVLNNTPARELYQVIVSWHLDLKFGSVSSHFSLSHFVNDFLMVGFFLLVGLEIRYEFRSGELSSRAQAVLPFLAAIAGMVCPVLIFLIFNWNHPQFIHGWAIPAATDIAFALAVMNFFGRSVPTALKVFLTAFAIIDDLGAIVIIAFFYSAGISGPWLGVSAIAAVLIWILAKFVKQTWLPYLFLAMVLWLGVLYSGIHATIAGVAIAWLIPVEIGDRLKYGLAKFCAFFILPVFAFMNSGVELNSSAITDMFSSLPLGIIAGLIVGKMLGIYGAVTLATRFKIASLPGGASRLQMLGVATLGGVGFTMSLFIGRLAFHNEPEMDLVRLGVISASIFSALLGGLFLALAARSRSITI
jgi:NhaA family Na+:H+ antiporter